MSDAALHDVAQHMRYSMMLIFFGDLQCSLPLQSKCRNIDAGAYEHSHTVVMSAQRSGMKRSEAFFDISDLNVCGAAKQPEHVGMSLLRGDEARRFALFVLDIDFSACIHKSLHTRVMAIVGSLMQN